MRMISVAFAAMGTLSMLVALFMPTAANSQSQALSLDDQVKLATQAAHLQLAKVPLEKRFTLEAPYFSEDKRFATFEVLSLSNRPGSAVLGRYTVDVLTGDLWDVYSCTRVQAPEIRRLQSVVRKQLHISDHMYKKLQGTRHPETPCVP